MLFREMELDFDLFEAEDADAYEKAVKGVLKEAAPVAGETAGDSIRRQCQSVFDFFDALFGDGFHRELFGERTNLLECLKAFQEFTESVGTQKAELGRMLEELGAGSARPANRAERRAALRAVQS